MDLSQIGKILKARRLERNMSIRELATASNIAGSTISQIETGKSSPNLLSLKSICDALDLPVFSLFLEDTPDNVRLVKYNEAEAFVRNISNGKPLLESLIIQGKNEMYGGLVDIPAHSDSGEYSHHGGEEFVFVLEGEIIFDLEQKGRFHMQKYDTLYYPNYIGHRWCNETEEPAKILMVSTSPYKF